MTLDDVFGPDGSLSQTLKGFAARDSQRRMAEAIQAAITAETHLIVEAGTGTGKTLAYLIPVFLNEKKAVLSTGTRNLQDQLYFRDIPQVRQTLASSKRVALLKGRSNYLCHYRLHQLEQGERLLSREDLPALPLLSAFKNETRTGDISELSNIAEDASIWPQVTSTLDNCLGSECPFIKECFILKARRAALAADIVVVNHHLFLSDLALQEDGFGELLPNADIVVFDEAHELPGLLSQFFSTRLSGRQLLDLTRDSLVEIMNACPELPELPDKARELQTLTRELRLALGADNQRAVWPDPEPQALAKATEDLEAQLIAFAEMLEPLAPRSKGLENTWQRAKTLAGRLNLLTTQRDDHSVRWFETHLQGFTLQLTPLTVADPFRPFLEAPQKTRIFTSATLTVASRFQSFVDHLGLTNAEQLQLESPFNYPEQALLYAPRGLPDPRDPVYTDTLIDAILPLLELTQGRTFLLFTSYRAMNQAADRLTKDTDFTLLIQGTLPKKILLDQFISLPRTVLLGTASFWQGVDVRGDALGCVVIDRLPFASPDDPVLQARMQKMRAEGLNPFQTCQLAEAVLALKQGAGRLIRDTQDRGVLVIGDPRLVGARYGQSFLQSLPPMSRTRDFEKVKEFMLQGEGERG